MAATREKRANAGNKMARLLNEEEEDDFYKTTYGGFDEVEQDHDYMFVAFIMLSHLCNNNSRAIYIP